VEAHLVIRDLNMQPTTTVSMLWARDLSPPVVKLFPKPALSAKTIKSSQMRNCDLDAMSGSTISTTL